MLTARASAGGSTIVETCVGDFDGSLIAGWVHTSCYVADVLCTYFAWHLNIALEDDSWKLKSRRNPLNAKGFFATERCALRHVSAFSGGKSRLSDSFSKRLSLVLLWIMGFAYAGMCVLLPAATCIGGAGRQRLKLSLQSGRQV